MGYYVTDPALLALANAGLAHDEQVGIYYQMDQYEIARAEQRERMAESARLYRERVQERHRARRGY